MEFELARASTGVTVTLGFLAALMAALALMFAWFMWSASNATAAIRDGALHIQVPLYGRSIAIADLDLDAARVVDVDKSSPLRPRMRTNGIGLPGYGVGWFRLRDGSKALMAMTSRRNMLYLPTRHDYVLLLSVADPERLLAQLRAGAART